MRHVLLALLVLVLCFAGLSAPEVTPIAEGAGDWTCTREFVIVPPDDWNMNCYRVMPNILPSGQNGDCRPATYKDCVMFWDLDFYALGGGQCTTCDLWVYHDGYSAELPQYNIFSGAQSVCQEYTATLATSAWIIYIEEDTLCANFGGDDDEQLWWIGLWCKKCNDDGV